MNESSKIQLDLKIHFSEHYNLVANFILTEKLHASF